MIGIKSLHDPYPRCNHRLHFLRCLFYGLLSNGFPCLSFGSPSPLSTPLPSRVFSLSAHSVYCAPSFRLLPQQTFFVGLPMSECEHLRSDKNISTHACIQQERTQTGPGQGGTRYTLVFPSCRTLPNFGLPYYKITELPDY